MRMKHFAVAAFFISTTVHAQVVLVSDVSYTDVYTVSNGFTHGGSDGTISSTTDVGNIIATATASQTSVISPPSFQSSGSVSLSTTSFAGGDASGYNQYQVTFDLLSSASF